MQNMFSFYIFLSCILTFYAFRTKIKLTEALSLWLFTVFRGCTENFKEVLKT